MSNFKPSVNIDRLQINFASYAELKKNLKSMILSSYGNEITVFRSRRGEWGEWFEKWCMCDGKPKIFKQGWM